MVFAAGAGLTGSGRPLWPGQRVRCTCGRRARAAAPVRHGGRAARNAAAAAAPAPPPLSAAAAAAAPGAPAPRRMRAKHAARSPEEKARHARPPGWVAPGPPPVGPSSSESSGSTADADLAPGPGETLSYLAGDWRIFQLSDGHRWSLDDHITAVVALQEAGKLPAPPDHALDLGCGIGSVLLMVAWGLPGTRCVGIEAQDVSIALARRSVVYNLGRGVGRVALAHQDLRAPLPGELVPPGGFQLITGTPPYIPLGGGRGSGRPQKEPCNLEVRGGVEDYVAAGALHLAADGALVLVMGVQGQQRQGRVPAAAAASGLRVARLVDVVPREGKPPLMQVWVLRWREGGGSGGGGGSEGRGSGGGEHGGGSGAAGGGGDEVPAAEVFMVRLADGSLSPEMHAARAAIGMPPAAGAPQSV